jgi:hypothetical protein
VSKTFRGEKMGSSVRIRESFMKKTGFELRFTGNGRQASKQKKKSKHCRKGGETTETDHPFFHMVGSSFAQVM